MSTKILNSIMTDKIATSTLSIHIAPTGMSTISIPACRYRYNSVHDYFDTATFLHAACHNVL